MIIHAHIPKRKRKLNSKHRQQKAAWEELLKKHKVDPKAKSISTAKIPEYKIPVNRSTYHIPSVDSWNGSTTKKETIHYTGDAMIGISTLHKSNAVPIFNKDEAEAVSKMRRG
jgi:hypothetical protein